MNRTHMGRGPGANIPTQGGIPGQISRSNTGSQSSSSSTSSSLTVIEMLEEPRRTLESNLITTYLAADKSGSIHVVFWGDAGASLKSGDIIRIQGGEARLFKSTLHISTKFAKYKRIGEDTLVFSEKPNLSECEWVGDAAHMNGPMIPIDPRTKHPVVPLLNGEQPMVPSGFMQPQRNAQGGNVAPAFNPAFDQRPGQRPFQQNQGGAPGATPHSGPMAGPGQGQGGFNRGRSFGGPGGTNANAIQYQQQQQQQQQPQSSQPPSQPQQPNVNGLASNVPSTGPGSNRSHHGPFPGHGNTPNNQQNQNQGPGNPGSGNGHHAPNARFNKHSKHSKFHRDLDAPDAYPSPRSGLSSSVDEFARDMKISLGSGAGPAGSGHMRKKPKVELD
ncbi:SOSS complex subunit B2 [Mortierella sp. GBA43]|nr:SOSS complex subunit B2 [Mortierella sp. GBA43]